MAMNSPFVGLSSFVATRQPNALLSVSMQMTKDNKRNAKPQE